MSEPIAMCFSGGKDSALALHHLRTYRERQLAEHDLACLFPICKQDTTALAHSFIQLGFRATTVCIHRAVLDARFVGRTFDRQFLAELPDGVDPCGENGEFHTFVSDGPIFSAPVPVTAGAVVERDGFAFCDLTASGEAPSQETRPGGTPPKDPPHGNPHDRRSNQGADQ